MSKGGGNQTTTTKTEIDPDIKAAGLENYDFAKQIADKPYQPYTGQMIAGFTGDTLAGNQMVRDTINNGVGQGALNSAMQTTANAAAYNPNNVYAPMARAQYGQAASAGPAAMANAAQVNSSGVGQVDGGNTAAQLQGYMNMANPAFQQGVVDSTLNSLDRARQMTQIQNAGQAVGAKAFGGSRHGVVEAETNRNFADAAAKAVGDLNMQGFNTALGALQQDLNRGLTAQQSNQNAGLSMAGQNANLQQQTNLANQGAFNNMSQFNAGNQQAMTLANLGFGNQANLANQNASLTAQQANQNAGLTANNQNLAAANQLASLGQTQRTNAFSDAAALQGIGQTQQAMDQAQLNQQYQDFTNARDYDLQRLGILQTSLGMTPYGQTTTATQPMYNNMGQGALGGAMMGTQLAGALGMGSGMGAGIGALLGIMSDENVKHSRKPVSKEQTLERMRKMPVEEWSYNGEDTRHVGPMAQSFQKNLGFGDGHMIPVVDAVGTTMASVQALADKVDRLEGKKRKGK